MGQSDQGMNDPLTIIAPFTSPPRCRWRAPSSRPMERGGLVLGFFAPPFPDVANPQEQVANLRSKMSNVAHI
jgi:hypothetical protein